MIVYHGSNARFDTLKISSSLVRYKSTLENEGVGIYFSLFREVAESYGNYLYTLEIKDSCLKDYRNYKMCYKYVLAISNLIYKREGISIYEYVDLAAVALSLYDGRVAINVVGNEIYLLLDSNYKWYESVKQSKIDKVYKVLCSSIIIPRDLHSFITAYLFNYQIKGIGIIKDLSCVRILKRERIE